MLLASSACGIATTTPATRSPESAAARADSQTHTSAETAASIFGPSAVGPIVVETTSGTPDPVYIEFLSVGYEPLRLHAHNKARTRKWNLNNQHRTLIIEAERGQTVKVQVFDQTDTTSIELVGLFLDGVAIDPSVVTSCSPSPSGAVRCQQVGVTVTCDDPLQHLAFHAISKHPFATGSKLGIVVGDPLVIIVPKVGECKDA